MAPMRITLCAATVLLAAAACWSEQATQPRPAGVVDLKLLYDGRPRSAREKDFVVFLEKHFKQVATGDLTGSIGRGVAGAMISGGLGLKTDYL